MSSQQTGLLIVIAGVVIVLVGLLVWAGGLAWFGHLPGDIRVERENTRVYIPITSMLLVSLVLSVALSVGLYVLRRFF